MNPVSFELFAYDNVRRLLYFDSDNYCYSTDNAPMNKRPIKVHKGIDNTIPFRVFDPDRKVHSLRKCDVEYLARVTQVDTGYILLERACKVGTATGILTLSLLESDLSNIDPGLYSLVIIENTSFTVDGEVISKPLFTDYDGNVSSSIEITEQVARQPRPTYTLTDKSWTPTRLGTVNGIVQQAYSSAIPGNRVGNIEGNHTFSVNCSAFTGNITIMGTLSESPSPDPTTGNEWFVIPPSSFTGRIECTNYTGTDAFFFRNNVMWVKFIISYGAVTDPGKVVKILARM